MNVSKDLVSPGPGDTNQHKTRWNNKHGRLQKPNRVNLTRGSNGRLLYQCSLNEFSNWAALLSVLWYHHSVVFIFAQPLSLFTALPKNSPNLPTANRCPQTSPPMLITWLLHPPAAVHIPVLLPPADTPVSHYRINPLLYISSLPALSLCQLTMFGVL